MGTAVPFSLFTTAESACHLECALADRRTPGRPVPFGRETREDLLVVDEQTVVWVHSSRRHDRHDERKETCLTFE
ncbi:hypothetical protein GCM10010174_11750 [Kutzneria viridogrisea]